MQILGQRWIEFFPVLVKRLVDLLLALGLVNDILLHLLQEIRCHVRTERLRNLSGLNGRRLELGRHCPLQAVVFNPRQRFVETSAPRFLVFLVLLNGPQGALGVILADLEHAFLVSDKGILRLLVGPKLVKGQLVIEFILVRQRDTATASTSGFLSLGKLASQHSELPREFEPLLLLRSGRAFS